MHKIPDEPPPRAPLPLSMLISERVYRFILLIERLLRWINRVVIRRCRYLVWCLRL